MASQATPRDVPAKFAQAMQQIYKFPIPLHDDANSWTPPPMTEGRRGRYLWTDGFGVVNFITLAKEQSSSEHYLQLAKRLVTTVHETLGRTRDLKSRLPGASDEWPLKGGLRIGKVDKFGSDGDGQYHHYLTVWMFALNRLSLATGEKWHNDQAISLASAIHPRFVYNRDSKRPRMYWKMSLDLSEPLTRSEGDLDPIDGYVTFKLLQETEGDENVLKDEIEDYRKILETKWRDYSSSDSLDLGITLWIAHRYDGVEEWASGLRQRAERCLEQLVSCKHFEEDIRYRLAIREFGTCLGVKTALTDSPLLQSAEAIVDRYLRGGREWH